MKKTLFFWCVLLLLPLLSMAQDALYVYPKQSADSLQIAFRILGKIAYEKESIKIDHRTGLLLFSAPYDNIQHMAFADHQPVFGQIYDTICAGENYTWDANNKIYTKPGTYTDTLQNIYGCDSIVTLHLEVLPDPPITFTVNGVSFKMMRVRAGTFMMGATPEQGTDAQANEKPAHQVTLTRDYFIGETMLTQELWTAVMGTTIQEEEVAANIPAVDRNLGYYDNYPMYTLSYNKCLEFIDKLNTMTGLTFRLPTEAEWEYAARGGQLSRGYKYPGSNNPDEVAWTNNNSDRYELHEVKLLKPNELGLYDMAGNIWEWVLDHNRPYTNEAQVNPIGDLTSDKAFIRGCSTYWEYQNARVSCRGQEQLKTRRNTRLSCRFVLDADRVIGEDNTTYQAFDTICAGETYTWNGNTYTKPGSYTDTLQNIYGCDSIVTLHLEVLPDPPLTFTVNGVTFKMMRVRAGTFMMGATADDVGAEADEFPRHEVTLTKDYFIGETEMTQALWQTIMGNNPSANPSNPQLPVNNMTFDDCQVMIAKLNELTGLRFRLPTEAEWEYAARGGQYSQGYKYAGSDNIDEVAWYQSNEYNPVAQLMPNELGLYDMSGNVYEWCQDWYNPDFYKSPSHSIDPFQAESVDGRRCVRGGCNMQTYGADTKKYSRIANRGYQITKESHVGLRLALEAIGIMENNREFVTYDTICAGESYTWDANKKIYTKPGTYTDTLQNIYGCDSIVTLHLEVLPDPPITFKVNGVSFKMMRVRAGTFMMGASDDDIKAEANERPAHQVTLTRDYFIAETMLTQELWTAVMGTTIQEEEAKGSGDKGLGYGPNFPMYCISYYDCQNFVKSLSDSIGLEFRMPTEAEWEYAARGGHLSRGYKYPGSNNVTEVAWNVTNDPGQKLHEVKQLLPNELGLYDMAGNTWEWVFDYNRLYTSEAQVNPIGDSLSTKAFVRGGSSYYSSHYNRVSCRGMQYSKTFKANRIAFRFVLDADRVIGEDNTTYQAYDTICSGETYSWNGNTYTKPGTYTDTLQNIYGCDSIVTLHLQVNPTYEVHDTVVACDSYLFNPFNTNGDSITIYQSGIYADTVTSISGCDSIFVLHLTINQSEVGTTEYATICHGETYTWNGKTYNTSDTYTLTLSNEQGCDSTATLVLTVLPESVTQTENVVIGSDQLPYIWRGQSLNAIGQYTDIEQYVAAACDSVIHVLNLNILATGATDEQTATICDTELPYQWYNQDYSTTGTYTHIEKYVGTDIDSIQHILHLTVNSTIRTEETVTACDSYLWNDSLYTQTGIYTYTTTAANGCDSIVTLHLTIHNSEIGTTDSATICYGDTYTWNGNIYTKPGTYTDTLQNMYGCDSIVTLHLDVLQDPAISFVVNGVSFNMRRVRAGTFMMGAPEEDIEAKENAKPAHQVTITRDYFIAETILTQELWTAVMGTTVQEEEEKGTGITGLGYGDNYPMYPLSYYDCQHFVDSLNKLTGLKFRMPTEAEWEYAARGGHLSKGYKYPGSNNPDEVAWTKYTVPDSKIKPVKQLLPNELGLYDMAGNVWEWVLDYNRPYTVEPQVDPIGDLSSNQAFMRGGSTYDKYTYLHNMVSYRGETFAKTYKSTRVGFRFVLDAEGILEDNQIYVTTATICAGESYNWDANTKTYTQPGFYTDTIQNIYGCDNIIKLHLIVNPTYEKRDTITACDSYTWSNGMTYTESGVYYDSLQTIHGCDSVEILTLTINNSIDVPYTVTACDSYTWSNGVTYTESGVYYDSLKTIHGCDSVEILTLTINNSIEVPYTVTACDSYTWSNGMTYTESGIYYDSLQTIHGCDSVEILTLTINNSIEVAYTVTACDSYTWSNGITYTESGIYYDSLKTIHGCDSVEILTLTINYRDTAFFTETACDSYTWHDQVYNTSGTYYYHTQTVLGCDSVEVLTLTINYRDTAFFTQTACDSYTWHDQVYNTSGTYYYHTQTVLGCDSVEVLNLTINYRDTAFFTQTACDSYTWHDQVYNTSGTYYYHTQTALGCDSVEVLNLTINYRDTAFFTETACDSYEWHGDIYTVSGTYYYDTLTVLGCDSLEVLHLTVNYGDTIDLYEVACDSYTWHGDIYTVSGTYYYDTLTVLGCDSLEILHLTVNYGDTIDLYEVACDSYTWHGDTYTVSGTYYYHTQTVLGCDSLEVLHLTVKYSTYFTYDTTVCGSYQFAEEELTMSGTYVDTITNVVGCDSIITVNLIVHPITPTQYVYDTICSCDLPYIFNDSIYSATGTYIQYYQNQYGCDSNIVLSLAVVEKLAVVVDSLPNLCADDKSLVIHYDLLTGAYDSLQIRFLNDTFPNEFYPQTIYNNNVSDIVYPFDSTIWVNRYTAQLEFYQHAACGNQIFDLPFDIQYDASIIVQKWNNFLALKNAKYNGGYTFTNYQWYKNGQPIDGGNGSSLRQYLDTTAHYYALLTRNDGVVMRTCDIWPTYQAGLPEFPTLVTASQVIYVANTTYSAPIDVIEIYSAMGHLVSTVELTNGAGNVQMPSIAGNYIVKIRTNDGQVISQLLVVLW